VADERGRDVTANVNTDSTMFRRALGSFTTGVTVVTTLGEDRQDVGLTVNSFNSVSLEPPMVLWSLARSSASLGAFRATRRFAIHVLSADQEPLSRRFASRRRDRFEGLALERGADGVPLLTGCAARFQCRTAFEYEGGDHVIFVGQVEVFDHTEKPPLVFHGGSYAVAVRRSDNAIEPDDEPESSFSQDFLGYLLAVAHSQVSLMVREELERRGLSEEEYLVLGMAAAIGDRTADEIDQAIKFTGRRLTSETVASLADSGLVRSGAAVDGDAIQLTATGRTTLIELAAIAKAAEADAEEGLDYGERQLLKQLLRRLIRETDPVVRSRSDQPASPT
jgi:3-hydroxy-9,10-secoandrosta-1,3,5(10)-triene-9,17-dione monooxygenase reductase component